MNTLLDFFNEIKLTFTSVSYYAEVIKEPLGTTIKFVFVFFFFYALILTSYATVRWYMPINDFVKTVPNTLVDIYPDELVITVDNGRVSTNVEEPYKIPLSIFDDLYNELNSRVLGEDTDVESIEYFMIIDTKASIDDISTYQTYVLLTETHLVYFNDDGNIEAAPLEGLTFTVNKPTVRNVVTTVRPFIKFLLPALIVLTFLGSFVMMPLAGMIYTLFFAGILWGIGKIISYSLAYKGAYQIGLHFTVASTIVIEVLRIAGVHISFPFLRTIVLSIAGVVLIMQLKKDVEPESELPVPSLEE